MDRLWVFLVLLLAGCKILPPAEMPQPPAEWSMIENASAKADQCPDINGVYSSVSETASFIDGHWSSAVAENYQYAHLVWGQVDTGEADRIEVNPASSIPGSFPDSDWIAVHLQDMELVFEVLLPQTHQVHATKWNGEMNQFRCEAGRIVFPTQIYLGGGEGRSMNAQMEISLGVAADGALVFHERMSVAKPTIFKRGLPKFWVYRFERIETAR